LLSLIPMRSLLYDLSESWRLSITINLREECGSESSFCFA
jgi:hypothetical protein